jgi:hypothetical protein
MAASADIDVDAGNLSNAGYGVVATSGASALSKLYGGIPVLLQELPFPDLDATLWRNSSNLCMQEIRAFLECRPFGSSVFACKRSPRLGPS